MTTTVTIDAHCSPSQEVHIVVGTPEGEIQGECMTLQSGQTAIKYIFDNRIIAITEVLK